MDERYTPERATQIIQQFCPEFTPKLAIILGSGLGRVIDSLENYTTIAYEELPGFPQCKVEGHEGCLALGTLEGLPVMCFQGRVHFYEGANVEAIKTMIRTSKLLGCDSLLVTNASGSIRKDCAPGELMLITDHINFQGINPLTGKNDDAHGERFVTMTEAYDPDLQAHMKAAAAESKITLHEGVYIGVLGPSFETPAEINCFANWGADIVGMSTVPDVIIARHCGLRVAAVSAITNYAAGLTDDPVTHAQTLENAQLASGKLMTLITAFVRRF